jgi:hypothetical protein
MLDPIAILAEARNLGANKTLADVEAALAQYDYETLRAQERTRYRVELWDKQTPINNVPPEVILQDVPKHPDGSYSEVYLIYIDGNLVYLQKHDPEQVGFVPMDADTALAKANKIVDELVEQAVDARVRQEVLRQLLAG